MIDEDVAHRAGRDREEVRARLPAVTSSATSTSS